MYFMEETTIKIGIDTLKRLDSMKKFNDTYDDVLNDLIEEELSEEELRELEEIISQKKFKPIEQVARELGVTLEKDV